MGLLKSMDALLWFAFNNKEIYEPEKIAAYYFCHFP